MVNKFVALIKKITLNKNGKTRIFLQISWLGLLLLLGSVSADAEQHSPVTSPGTSATQSDTQTPVLSDPLIAGINLLKERSFSKKAKAIDQLQSIDDPRIIKIFKYLLVGNLYYRKADKLVVYLDKADNKLTVTNVISGESLGKINKSDFKKIIANNRMRRQMRTRIARLSLGNRDTTVRLSAVREMLSKPTSEGADLVRVLINQESDRGVKDAMATLMALTDLNSDNKEIRLLAIKQLNGNLENAAFNKLGSLLEKDDAGSYLEQDKDIIKAANSAINRIKDKRKFYEFLETIFFGLSLGSVLLLTAIGLAITFGVMGVINMAHGELIMLGAYTTYVIQLLMPNHIEYSLFAAIPAAFIVSGLVGVAIERGVIRFLYGRPLETLLATFGISLILQQLVRSIFGTLNLAVETPAWMSGALEINSAFTLTYNRFYIVLFSLMVFLALLTTLKKTPLGLQVRAVSQNRSMAKAMGVRTEWVDALTFALGSGIAGVAGVALSQLTNVGSNLGQAYIIDSFMVVVFGGVGNLWGTLVGAMSLGEVNKFIEPWSGAVMAKILILIVIILFIQKKPRGLFPQKGRAAENEVTTDNGLSAQLLDTNKGGKIFLGILAGLAISVPVCNLIIPESSAFHLSTYAVTLLGKYMTFALLAVALDLVWGYCGILSLGHAAFFALGGYAMGMYLMRQIGDRGVYGNPELPDFMVFLNWPELPWYWYGFDHFGFAMLMVMVVPGVLAFVFGWLAFRSRVTGVYLSIMTQALTYASMLAFFRNEMGFGGNNGLTDFKDILGFNLQQDSTRIALFLASTIALASGYLACRYIITSKFGRVIIAIRDAEDRTRFVGYKTENYKLWIFTFSAVLSGIAGALYVPQVGIINPGEFSPLNSIELVVWVAVGGRGTLYGAALGGGLVNYAKTYFTGALPEIWLFALGTLFIVVTVFLPKGIIGLTSKRQRHLQPEKPLEPAP